MPIISEIGRKSWRLRLLIWSMYLVLTLGAVTMVYPFMMMLSLSTASYADFKENRLIPRYWHDEDALFRKYAQSKYYDVEQFNLRHGTRYPDFSYGQFQVGTVVGANFPRIVSVPFDLADPHVKTRLDDYSQWKRGYIEGNWPAAECLYVTLRPQNTINLLLDKYVAFLLDKYGSLDGINAAYLDQAREFREITAIRERPTFRTFLPGQTLKIQDWQEFKKRLAAESLEFISIGDVEAEWGKYLQSKYSSEESYNEKLGARCVSLFSVPLPSTVPPEGAGEAAALRRADWIDFVETRAPLRSLSIRDADARWRRFLEAKYGAVEALNAAHGSALASFDDAAFPSDIDYNSIKTTDVYNFVASDLVAPEDIVVKGPRHLFADYLEARYGSVDAANAAHSMSYARWDDVRLPRRLPLHETPVEQADWREFVVSACPTRELLDSFDARRVREFLRGEYGTIDKLNAAWGSRYGDFRDVKCPRRASLSAAQAADMKEMLAVEALPLFDVRIPDAVPDSLYRDFLKARYASLAAYNAAIRLYPSWQEVRRPIDEAEWSDFAARRREFKRLYITGNYSAVMSYMALHGRAFLNTAILCGAMVIAALTVNPLCAYALSRFQLSYANSILLFLLATMAFPVAVTQIPSFLMLKNLGMLNTFWALILPGLANGYSIFLLKGFFDSLPQELFEAGLIDGASEVQMFYRIALPLTTPILAVIALGAFTLAYGQFMWAFVVCQDPKYWTIMVWLYQFQQDYAVPLVMAGLVLASIPTLIVFIAAQKVILRGIVVPQMK
jgi:multiple sugar transport system permease protein